MSTGKTYSTKYLLDSKNNRGAEGQVLSSTDSGIDWVTLSEISGVDGTGTANYLSKWLDANTITNSLVYDNGTNVGIGTTSPDKKLNVHSGTTSDIVKFQNNNGSIVIGKTANLGSLDMASDASFRIRHGSTVSAFFKSTGNVGIGTTSPSELLEVSSNTGGGSGTANPTTIRISDSGQGSAWDTSNSFTNLDFYSADSSGSGAGTKARVGAIAENSTGAKIGLAFSTTNTTDDISEKLRIDATGNVGIGTTSPNTTLHLATSASSTLTIQNTTNSGNASLKFRDEGDNDQYSVYYAMGANRAYNSVNGNGLTIYSSQVSAEIARFGNSSNGYQDSYFVGNVGIGTTSPVGKLNINTGLTGISYDMVNQANGSISFSNNSGGTAAPTITGKSNNNLGLMFVSGTNNTGPVADMYFDVRENNNTDYATLTSSAYRFNRAGNPLMTILRSGNVGIGTTNPDRPLHIIGQFAIDNSTSPSGGLLISPDGNSNKIYSRTGNANTTAHPLDFISGSSTSMRIAANGDVGIGTTSPLGKLHVRSANAGSFTYDTNADDLIVESNANGGIAISTAAANTSRIIFASPDDPTGGEISFNQTAKLMKIGPTTANGLLALQSANGVETMRLDASNRVGIGTTNPNDKLHVYGGRIAVDNLASQQSAIRFFSAGTEKTVLYRPSNSDDFRIFKSGITADALTILNSNGNVGIGTTNPIGKLTISDSGGTGLEIHAQDSLARVAMVAYDRADSAYREIYSEGYNFNFNTSGTNTRLSILNNGNVGIGTTSPAAKLDVSHASDQGTYARFSRGTTNIDFDLNTAYAEIKSTIKEFRVGTSDSQSFHLVTNNSNQLTIDSSGEVGIGTNNPSAKLHVQGSSATDVPIIRVGGFGNSGSTLELAETLSNGDMTYGFSFFNDGNSSNTLQLKRHSNSSAGATIVTFNRTDNNVSFAGGLTIASKATSSSTLSTDSGTTLATKNYVDAQVGSADTLQEVTDNGNTTTNSIGIGTTNPSEKLHVFSSSDPTIKIGGGVSEGTTGGTSTLQWWANNGSVGNAFIATYYKDASNDRLTFIDGGLNNVLTLKNGGNVGIGTTSPASKLQVSTTNAANILTLHRDGSDNGANTTLNRIQFAQDYNSTQENWGRIDLDSNASPYRSDLKFYVKSTSGSEMLGMTVHGTASDGPRVGIGTASPEVKLHVGTSTLGTAPDTDADIISSGGITIENTKRLSFDTAYYVHGNIKYNGTGSSVTEAKLEYQGYYGHNFITRSSSRMVISGNTGNVGIGITSPLQLLHLKGDSSNPYVRISSGAFTGLDVGQEVSAGNAIFNLRDNKDIRFLINGSDVIRVKNTGNVGIGTTSPAQPLHVLDDSSANVHAKIRVQGGSTSGYADLGVQSNYVRLLVNDVQTTAYSGAVQYNYINGNVATTLTSTGLGISTTSPQAALHVAGSIGNSPTGDGVLMGLNNNYGHIQLNGSTGSYIDFSSSGVDRKGRILYNNAGNYMQIQTNGSDKVRITSSGNVGIGTTNPSDNLTVEGGGITLGGTGRIQGIDTVSASTDAANKAYVDAQVGSADTLQEVTDNGNTTTNSITFAGGTSTGDILLGAFNKISGVATDNLVIGVDKNNASGNSSIDFQLDGSTSALFINNSRNVGIGTTNPNTKLEVATSANVNSHSDGAIQVVSSSPIAFVAPSNLNPSLNRWGFTLREGGEGHFGIRDYRHANTRVTIDDSGNVGIGTTSPAYKLDVNGGINGTSASFSAGVKANQGFANNVNGLRLSYPSGGTSTGQVPSQTGAIKITLPQSWTNTMMRMTIKVYEYTTNESFTLVCGGYNYTGNSSWINEFAYIESSAKDDRNFTVRFGHDGTKCCIYIGELNSGWTYPQIYVTDFEAGFSSATASLWQTGWNVGFEASAFGTITHTETDCQINNWARSGQNTYFSSGTGNVGIGTTSPSTKLYVKETGAANTAIFENSGQAYSFAAIKVAEAQNNKAVLSFAVGDALASTNIFGEINGIVTNNGGALTGDLYFKTNQGDNMQERMRILANGNVGIGTTAPCAKLEVDGHFAATSKSFIIDHPTKEDKKLQYASLEGPENGVYVRGTTDKETIELPEYWSELVHEDSITVVLTPIGKKQDLFIIEKSNKLIKIGGAEGSFDYVVYGERKDIDKLEIEPLKV